jgi:hypothetical protein
MFRFFKGKWVGEDELREKVDCIKSAVSKNHELWDRHFKKETELLNIIEEKEKTIQELRGEVKLYQIQLCDLKEAFGWRGE